MARAVGVDVFVSKARLDALGIASPSASTLVDTGGSLGDSSGATYRVVGTQGPSDAPTGYILRRVEPTPIPPGDDVQFLFVPYGQMDMPLEVGVSGSGNLQWIGMDAVDGYAFPCFPNATPANGLQTAGNATRMLHGGEWTAVRARCLGPFIFGTPLGAADSGDVLTLRLLKNGVEVGSATWAAGEEAAKDLTLTDALFEEDDAFSWSVSISGTDSPDAMLISASFGVTWAA